MTVGLNWDLEMDFGAGFVSVKADVRQKQISAFWGNRTSGPTDRIAETGTFQITLDNSTHNTGALLGYYSPGNSNARAGFGLGTEMRLKLVDTAGTSYKKYYVSDIAPVTGALRSRAVQIGGIDYIGQMSVQYSDGLAVQTNKTVDQALADVVALMPNPPDATSYAAGLDNMKYIFHDIGKEVTNYNAVQRLLQNDLGYVFCKCDGTAGETLTYETRHTRLTTVSAATLDNAQTELTLNYAVDQIFNNISVVVYPVAIGTVTETIYTLQTEQDIERSPFDNNYQTFDAYYRDPDGQGIGIALNPGTQFPDSSGTPVPNVDYAMHSIGDSAPKNDLTSLLGISIVWYGSFARVTLTNNATVGGYVNASDTNDTTSAVFRLRGRTLRLYDPVSITSVDTAANLRKYGNRPLKLIMPYLSDFNVAQDFATHLRDKWKQEYPNIDYIEFVANADAERMTNACMRDIGDKITISETVSGLSVLMNIAGVEKVIEPGGLMRVRWYLERFTGGGFWVLGVVGASELGDYTYLGY